MSQKKKKENQVHRKKKIHKLLNMKRFSIQYGTGTKTEI